MTQKIFNKEGKVLCSFTHGNVSTEVKVQVKFGVEGKFKIKKKLVLRYIKLLMQKGGDPEFTVVIEFGEKKFRWHKYGTPIQQKAIE